MNTRYIKVFRDLASDYSKNIMLIVAIALGVFGIGAILGGYSVIKREMTDNYLSTVPASATLELEKDISNGLLDSVRKIPGIQEAERHATVTARMQVDDKWFPLLLFVVDDFTDKRTNKPHHLSGEADPSPGSMLVERTALIVMNAKEGDDLLVKTPHGQPMKIKLSGTVHDPGLAPAWQEQAGYGYISLATLHALGEMQGFNQLRILVSEHPYSRDHIVEKAQSVAHQIERAGYTVHEIQVPSPGKHPHQSQMSAVMSIFIVFSFMILMLGSILVATSMATLMVKQVRQIGVMKTIGANSVQVMSLYAMMMVLLCVLALVIAIPLSRLAAAGFYRQLAVLLNLEINDDSIPYWVALVQVGSGLVIPLIAAALPVIRGSRITVKNALDNYGVAKKYSATTSWVMRFSQGNLFSETFRLAIRNVFRQRSRLVMTLGLLAAGGAMFMTALNVSEAWETNLKRIYTQRLYDLEVHLNNFTPADSIVNKIKAVQGVRAAEAWSSSPTSVSKDKGMNITSTYPDKGHASFSMLALPVPTQLLNPTVVEGKWLHDPTAHDVVLNQSARGLFKIGDEVKLAIEEKVSIWRVIGFVEDVGSHATAYVSLQTFSAITNTTGQAELLRISYLDRSKENAMRKNFEIERLLEKERIAVSSTIPVWLLRNAIAAHMKVLVNSLLAMALLMAVVGTIGLVSTMSMSVLERIREIGVMRAIGATPAKIRSLIVWEGLLIGTISIILAVVLSVVLSTYMGRLIGDMAFRTPLSLTISAFALTTWVVAIFAVAYVAVLLPARRANRISTREALAYE